MIQPNELRIGNIYNRKHGKGWTVTVIDEKIMGGIFSDSTTFAFDDFEPIPLTPEWLEAAGFEKDKLEFFYINIPYHSDYFKKLLFIDDFLYLKEGVVNEPREGDDMVVVWNNLLRGTMHLHQLQNLYFALTGEELTVKQKA